MSGDDIQDQLAKLPLRAIVAFAVRCARRVQPLGRVLTEYRQVEVDDAIAIAEGFARGGKADRAARAVDAARAAAAKAAADSDWVDADDAEAAAAWADATVRAVDAAACAARAANAARAADIAAADAAAARAAAAADAAEDTARAAWDTGRAASRTAARGDLHQLLALELGRPGTLGKPIDPAEDGPLGPLWPNAAPDWYTNPPKLSDESNPPTASLDD